MKTELNLDHLYRMTDSTGVIQHAKYSIPDLVTGYTTDDNARMLLITCMLYKKSPEENYLSLIYRYLSFLHFAQNENGRWKNFMNYQREFVEYEGSEDSFGRSLWALGYLSSLNNLPEDIHDLSNTMIKAAIPNIEKITFIRSLCYSLLGLVYLYAKNKNAGIINIIKSLSDKIEAGIQKNKTSEWYWSEDIVTYSNGIIPYCLLKAYQVNQRDELLQTAMDTLKFLDSLTMKNGYLKLIGCKGWAVKGSPPSEFDEQPVDAADMALAFSEAYKVTKNKEYLDKCETCFRWFYGRNCHNTSLINLETGGCCDGITSTGINRNQGAESLFAYIISHLTAEELGINPVEIKEEKAEKFEEAV